MKHARKANQAIAPTLRIGLAMAVLAASVCVAPLGAHAMSVAVTGKDMRDEYTAGAPSVDLSRRADFYIRALRSATSLDALHSVYTHNQDLRSEMNAANPELLLRTYLVFCSAQRNLVSEHGASEILVADTDRYSRTGGGSRR